MVTHALSGVERALRRQLVTYGPVELMGNALRLFGEEIKVRVEIAVMAADASLIAVDRDVICVAETEGARRRRRWSAGALERLLRPQGEGGP